MNDSHHAVHYISITYLFYNQKIVSFDHLHTFYSPFTPSSNNHQSVLYSLYTVSLFVQLLFQSPHVSELIQYLFSSIKLISLIIRPSGFIHVVSNRKISFFLMDDQYSIVCVHACCGRMVCNFLYPFICQWMLRLSWLL